MKRVLIITYYWPPSGGSGVQRWVKFAKYLPAEGWQPVVYAPENPSYQQIDETLAAEIPAEAEIIRRPIREPYAAYRRLMGRSASTDIKALTKAEPSFHGSSPEAQKPSFHGSSPEAQKPSFHGSSPEAQKPSFHGSSVESPAVSAAGGVVTPISSGRKSWKQRLSLWIRGNLFVPDPRVGWVRPSVRFLKKYLREHPVDVIVTTGPPHSMHLIGQRLHAALGLPWISDFRDPWTKMYYLKHLGMTRRTWRRIGRMEQAVLDESTTVLAVTPAVQADFRARTATPVAMITNGFDEDDFATAFSAEGCTPSSTTAAVFTITHTGLFAADGNPMTFWKVLGEMAAEDASFRAALQLRLCGKTDREVYDAIAAAGLADVVVDLGYVDHATAVREQCGASLLLLPLRNDPEYKPILPGKLFEYLATRRPILGIGQEDGAMADVLRETGAGVMCDWGNAAGIRAALALAWEKYKAGVASVPFSGTQVSKTPGKCALRPTFGDASHASGDEETSVDPVARYSRRNLTHELAALLNSVSSPPGK